MNYGDIIEYIDGTRDLHFEEAHKWCKLHNVTFNELVERRNLPNRYFQIGYPPEPHVPTQEEQRLKRAFAYQQQVDPITSHIQRLRDKEQTEEIIEKINELIIERDEKVQDIVNKYPYPIGEDEENEEIIGEV